MCYALSQPTDKKVLESIYFHYQSEHYSFGNPFACRSFQFPSNFVKTINFPTCTYLDLRLDVDPPSCFAIARKWSQELLQSLSNFPNLCSNSSQSTCVPKIMLIHNKHTEVIIMAAWAQSRHINHVHVSTLLK